jgi:hypothetical protein
VTSPEYIFLYGDPQFEAIKGHVDYDVARLLCGDQGIDIDETFKIEHLHARWVPSANWSEWALTLQLVFTGPARGAFPITIAWYPPMPAVNCRCAMVPV